MRAMTKTGLQRANTAKIAYLQLRDLYVSVTSGFW